MCRLRCRNRIKNVGCDSKGMYLLQFLLCMCPECMCGAGDGPRTPCAMCSVSLSSTTAPLLRSNQLSGVTESSMYQQHFEQQATGTMKEMKPFLPQRTFLLNPPPVHGQLQLGLILIAQFWRQFTSTHSPWILAPYLVIERENMPLIACS